MANTAKGLDAYRKREVLAILSVGCSRRTAARYVGCSPSTIARTAQRDAAFAEELRKAELKAQILFMKNIAAAARKEPYWRAAAWALERLNPEEFGPRKPDLLTADQVRELLAEFADLVVQEVPAAKYRKNILRRLRTLGGSGIARAILPEHRDGDDGSDGVGDFGEHGVSDGRISDGDRGDEGGRGRDPAPNLSREIHRRRGAEPEAESDDTTHDEADDEPDHASDDEAVGESDGE
ncbi:MAG: hypothetical protein ACUVTW_10225 [Thermogutta sp.]